MMNRHIKEKQRINQVSNIAKKYSKKDAKSIANILQNQTTVNWAQLSNEYRGYVDTDHILTENISFVWSETSYS